jgi:hypothetical protein
MHIQVEGSFKSWREWAVRSGVNPKVIGFLSFRQDYLMKFDASSGDLAFPTPRSWEMVSNLLNNVSSDATRMHPLISGIVGTGTAVEFRTWAQVFDALPSLDDIFAGKDVAVPKQTDVLYALVSAMTAYAREHKTNLNLIANSIRFALKLPPDFSVILMKDYMYIEKDFKATLMKIPEFARWLQTKGKLLNGSV